MQRIVKNKTIIIINFFSQIKDFYDILDSLISIFRNCVDYQDETANINSKIKDTGEHSKAKNTNKQSSLKSSSRAQMNKHSNEVSNDLINHTSGNEQNMYASNLEDKSNTMLNSCIPSSETEPLVKVKTTGNGATHPV